MKKAFMAFGVLAVALVMLGAPSGAQTPADITATISGAQGGTTNVVVTAAFTSPQTSAAAQVQISTSGGAAPSLVSFTSGLSSCISSANAVTCQWLQPAANVSPQTLVISVPAGAAGSTVTFNANVAPATAGATFTQKATTTVTIGQATTTTAAGGATTTGSAGTTTIAPTTTAAATTTVAPPPTEAPTTTAATTTAGGTLPATGSDSNLPIVIGLGAIAAGVLLVGGARVRRSLQ
jgi:LPXTG-motif cell wall-anchored protein